MSTKSRYNRILRDKITAWSYHDAILKAIEEAEEYLESLKKYEGAYRGKANQLTLDRLIRDVAREFADVEITGRDTLSLKHSEFNKHRDMKRRYVYDEYLPTLLGVAHDMAMFAGDGDA